MATSDAPLASVAEKVGAGRERILSELRKVIVGQDEVVDQILIALFTGGHCLITGVPGLAKTLLVKTLAEILDLSFKRIQFTPDLMPADITGTEILDEDAGVRSLRFVKGPVFAQIILADEINRTPPKTQAALLEAMQEYHVTAAGRTYALERPFFVLATQNPIELEGTYPLPEAQLDRFMFNLVMTYLSEDEEVRVVTETTSTARPRPQRVLAGPDILQFQQIVRSARRRRRRAVRGAPRGRVAARTRHHQEPSRFRGQMGQVGRRPPGIAGPHPRRQGARPDAWPLSRVGGRHTGARAADPAASRDHQLLRRIRAGDLRRRNLAADRIGAAAEERTGRVTWP
jgi:MoxR-like ATPase